MKLQILDDHGKVVYELIDIESGDLDPRWSHYLDDMRQVVIDRELAESQ